MSNLLARELNKGLTASRRIARAPVALKLKSRPDQVHSMAQRFDRAIALLETGDGTGAFAELTELANQGHPPASRIALMLARRGTSLFGGTYPATDEQRACWQQNGE